MHRSSKLLLATIPRFGSSSTSPLAIAPRLALSQSIRAASSSATTSHSGHTKPATQWSTQYRLYPPGLLLAPMPYVFPIDVALNVVIPVHMYYGFDLILNDYVYGPSSRYIAKAVLIVITVLTTFGLSKINLKDVGISQGLKLMWKDSTGHAKI